MTTCPIRLCIVALALLLAACGAPPPPQQALPTVATTPAQAVILPDVTPEVVAGQLQQAATLQEAADQVANALQIDAQALRVRIQRDGCTVCALEENRENTSVEGLSLLDAAARLQPEDQLYLFVSRFACIYRYDGQFFTPQECRRIPI